MRELLRAITTANLENAGELKHTSVLNIQPRRTINLTPPLAEMANVMGRSELLSIFDISFLFISLCFIKVEVDQ